LIHHAGSAKKSVFQVKKFDFDSLDLILRWAGPELIRSELSGLELELAILVLCCLGGDIFLVACTI
jgi:hypothetical protein